MYMKGVDDKAFKGTLPEEPVTEYQFSGGFVELDYCGMLNNGLHL
jgi:hypothetical protein